MTAVTEGLHGEIRPTPPPLTVIGPAPLPSMVMANAVLLRVSELASVMVVALAKSVGLKVMSAALVSVLAWATAHGRLPVTVALLLVLVTTQELGTTRSSRHSICGRQVGRAGSVSDRSGAWRDLPNQDCTRSRSQRRIAKGLLMGSLTNGDARQQGPEAGFARMQTRGKS